MDNLFQFFGLKEDPFRLTPDPSFYYPSAVHQEAVFSIEYVIKKREGFCVVTGEPGTGKTTLLNVFLERWKDEADIALINTPSLIPKDFLYAVFEAFKIPYSEHIPENMKQFKEFLEKKNEEGRLVIIMVDEAQGMPEETMETLRLLSNLETAKEKLVQIILIGQPELDGKLRQKSLRQFDQRITERITLKPLTMMETDGYINHRLMTAGMKHYYLHGTSVNIIYKFSKGIPRLINLLLSRTIMAAYIDGSQTIKPKHINHAAKYLSNTGRKRFIYFNPVYVYSLAIFLGILFAFAGYSFYTGRTKPDVIARTDRAAEITAPDKPGVIPSPPVQAEIKMPETAAVVETPAAPGGMLPERQPEKKAGTDIFRVTVRSAVIRAGPGLDTEMIGAFSKGITFIAQDSALDSRQVVWYKVYETEDEQGWISEEVVEKLR